MSVFGLLRRMAGDHNGAAAVEFALLAPLFFAAMFGVLQIGLAMQSYNAIRNVAADTARYSLVEYQRGGELSNTEIATQARGIATGVPYLLKQTNMTVAVDDAETQRIGGVKEMNITIGYTIPTVLPLPDYIAPTISHSQPIFVLDGS